MTLVIAVLARVPAIIVATVVVIVIGISTATSIVVSALDKCDAIRAVVAFVHSM
ncbi:MAG TPA: hypothetical protein VMB19_15315 [Silvibacterium sp.]|nr:hypothetical protein [Silvibacterium sp.]